MALVAVVAVLHGSDAVPIQTEPDSAAIAAAKEQLDALKSSNTAARVGIDTKLAPQLPMTPLNPTNDYVAPPTKQKPDAIRRRRSENWLVDAVMRPDAKEPANRDRRNDRGATRSEDRAFGNSTTTFAGSETGLTDGDNAVPEDPLEAGTFSSPESTAATPSRSATAVQRIEKPDRAADFNPFAQYLSDWLSPQDSSLLKSTGDATNLAQPGAIGPSSLSIPSDSAGSTERLGIAAFTDRGTTGAPKAEDNPFLQFLKAPDSPPPPPIPAPADVSPAPMPRDLPTLPDVTSKSTIPDFAKPGVDDKNWQPLKRF